MGWSRRGHLGSVAEPENSSNEGLQCQPVESILVSTTNKLIDIVYSFYSANVWDFNLGTDFAIIEIVINHGDVVDTLSFKNINRATGKIVSSGTYGGTGGIRDPILIIGFEEHLTLISGTVFDYFRMGNLIVQSLTFHTNKTNYGPFGLTSNSTFEIPTENGEIVGFFGRASAFIDSIGIHVKFSAN
ncbi:hypothetical protein ACOSP7_031959 [Xanthoceras sorbifolium]